MGKKAVCRCANPNFGERRLQPERQLRMPYIGLGSQDLDYHVLPHLAFRNSAHIVTVCEAHDDHGGIAAHQQLAHDHSMLGMVVRAELTAPSIAIFIRGSHNVGTFIELIGHYLSETENKEDHNKFWLLHGAIFGLAHGRITSGEIVDPYHQTYRHHS